MSPPTFSRARRSFRSRVFYRVLRSRWIGAWVEWAVRFFITVTQGRFGEEFLYRYFIRDTQPIWNGVRTVQCRIPGSGAVRLRLPLEDWMGRLWYFSGYSLYEPGTVRLLRELLPAKRCFVDVGSGIGYYTVLAARTMPAGAQIHAFEPDPYPYRWLFANREINGFSSVRLNQSALSSRNEHATLFLAQPESIYRATLQAGHFLRDGEKKVEALRLETYCDQAGVPRVDLIKIDVDGGETEVLLGAEPVIDRHLPDIICEVLSPEDQGIQRFFDRKPYRKFVILEDGLLETDQVRATGDFRKRNYYFSVSPPQGVRIRMKREKQEP